MATKTFHLVMAAWPRESLGEGHFDGLDIWLFADEKAAQDQVDSLHIAEDVDEANIDRGIYLAATIRKVEVEDEDDHA